uniref:Uncharacterized protein n=1 Tax=viral metagenome TaxID=1070528 RepID=A0A6M3LJX7_9ZZZZ
MTGGVKGSWQAVVDNIRELSKEVYVTLGMVFNEENVISCIEAVLYADSLNPSDIRIIPSAQYNKALTLLADLPTEILSKYPILRYRIINLRNGTPVRGIQDYDSHQCPLVLDDMFVAAGYHFPCVIYMREGGEPIGKINTNTRKERYAWFKNHNTHADNICRQNCLDVCREYNNAWESYRSAQ